MMIRSVFVVTLFSLFSWVSASEVLPIFDTHVHYNESAWESMSPSEALSMFDRAGIYRALVSSTPDEGTRKLYQAAPGRVVPFLRLHRSSRDSSNWAHDLRTLAYLEEHLQKRVYRGIGEVTLDNEHLDTPVVRGSADIARDLGLFFQVHTDATAMEGLVRLYPDVRFIWTHMGMNASPSEVRHILEHSENVWVETSLRSDVAPGGILNPAWRDLFLRFPDRFMVGSDTWTDARWDTLPQTAKAIRNWLRQLPIYVAERMAFRNAERLFGNSSR